MYTKTFNITHTIAGEIFNLKLISYFAGSGTSNETTTIGIMEIGNYKIKLPEEATIAYIENIDFLFSDLDNDFDNKILIYGSTEVSRIEVEFKIDSTIKFLGNIDLSSIAIDDKNLTVKATVVSKVNLLKEKDVDTDLAPLITNLHIYGGLSCFNLKECIETIFGMVDYVSGDLSWSINQTFPGASTTYYFQDIWIVKDDYFGTSKIHDFKTVYDLLKSFLIDLGAYAVMHENRFRIYNIDTEILSTSFNVIEQIRNIFPEKIIDGIKCNIIGQPAAGQFGNYTNGKNVKEIEFILQLKNTYLNERVFADNGSSNEPVDEVSYETYGPDEIDAVFGKFYYDFYSSRRKTIKIKETDENTLFDKITINSINYQLNDVQNNFLKKTTNCEGRNLS